MMTNEDDVFALTMQPKKYYINFSLSLSLLKEVRRENLFSFFLVETNSEMNLKKKRVKQA